MTDTRLPTEWLLGPLIRLEPTAFRSYVCALMWSGASRTDGVIEPADLLYIPAFDRADIPELVGCDLWEPRIRPSGNSWLIVDFRATQTSRAEHESLARHAPRIASERPGNAPPRTRCPVESPVDKTPDYTGRKAGRKFSYVPEGDEEN